jgi:peptidoglycan/xylan/chitin deacetylase (PgdA/CDA1 family)
MKRALRMAVLEVARRRPFERAVDLLERFDRSSLGTLPVLTYHRVDAIGSRPDLDPALISATPDQFERQMSWVAANRTVLSLDELLEIRRGRMAVPERALLVTFDDAYLDFATGAWPVLRRHGLPVTMFVPTAYPDSDVRFWWDRLHAALSHTSRRAALETQAGRFALVDSEQRRRALERLRAWIASVPHDEAMELVGRLVDDLGGEPPAPAVLGWQALRELAAAGVALAPHSRSHARLDRLPLERLAAEIAGSRADLVRELGACPPVFAFPGGGHDADAEQLLAREGFEVAFTTRRGSNAMGDGDWLSLRRTNVGRRASLALIRAELVYTPVGRR